jgi:hypothetical protein
MTLPDSLSLTPRLRYCATSVRLGYYVPERSLPQMSVRDTKAAHTLLAHSTSPTLPDAAREWRFTHAHQGLRDDVGTCELCGYGRLRHRFEIHNAATGHHLWIGYECVVGYIPIALRSGTIDHPEAKAAYICHLVANTKKGARSHRAFALIDALKAHDPRLDDTHWKGSWRTGYSVKQLQAIAVLASAHELPFDAADFRISTHLPGAVDDMLALEWWQYRQLRRALPLERQKRCDAHFRDGLQKRVASIESVAVNP